MEKIKNCPYCGEEIKADARKCRHCGEWLEEEPIQEQPTKADNKGTAPSACQNVAPARTEKPEPSETQALKEKTPHHNSKKWLLVIVPIVVVLVGVVLYLFGVLENESILNGSQSKKGSSAIGLNQSEDEIKAEIEKQVLEAYRTHEIYNLETPDFKEAGDAASAAEDVSGYLCIDWDYYYCTQDEFPDRYIVKRVDLVNQNKAHVYVELVFESNGFHNTDSVVLVMVRGLNESIWLIDDVGLEENSIKETMKECANSLWEEVEDDYGYDNYTEQVEDESALDLDHVSFEEYFNSRFGFMVLYPSFFVRKSEACNMDGCTFLYGHNFSMKAFGRYNVFEETILELFENEKKNTDTYEMTKDNWFVVSGINEQGNIYYIKRILENDVVYTVELIYPQSKKTQYDAVVKKVVNSFEIPTVEEDNSIRRMVVIEGTQLRLRLGPSTSSETLKWGDGSNRHPEVGEKFRYLDESSDFYKIDYKGNEVWVSKQFTHIETQ